MAPIITQDDLIDMLRRRARLILIVTFLGSVFFLLLALSQKHLYRATEVIQVARPMIANDLAASTVSGSTARRLQLTQQRMMARGSLLEVISAYNLYAQFPGLRISEMVDRLRKSVKIESVAAVQEGNSDDGTVAALSITAEMAIPAQAQQVAHELSRRMIELSDNSRINQSRETLAFFTAQEEELSAEMNALEGQIANLSNENYLAAQNGNEFGRSEIGDLNQAILLLDREIILINRKAEDVKGTERRATARPNQESFDTQLASMSAQRLLLLARKTNLENLLNISPELERELGVHDRQMRLLRGQFEMASIRRAEAEVGLGIENARQGKNLMVIEPAALPDTPIDDVRKRIAILGGVLSLALGIALALWAEMKNPVIRTGAQMKRELGCTPVVLIPYLDPTRPKTSFWQRVAAWINAAAPKDGSVA